MNKNKSSESLTVKRTFATSQERLFAMWIILHRPLALAMYVLAFMHITLSYMFSANLS